MDFQLTDHLEVPHYEFVSIPDRDFSGFPVWQCLLAELGFQFVSIPDRDFSGFPVCLLFGRGESLPVSIPDRDFSGFPERNSIQSWDTNSRFNP